jgi:hypothetical protein
MNVRSLLLRTGTLLPKRSSLPGRPTYEGWLSLDAENAYGAGVEIRAAGWHFMWLKLVSSGTGIGFTAQIATRRAMRSGLDQLNSRFNIAELMNVSVRNYLGLHVAHVKLASRHVQECASLGLVDEAIFREFPKAVVPERCE